MHQAARRRQLSPRDEGFSLVELIVAMVVIAVVLMLLIGVQIQAMASVTEARKLQQATALANEAVEQMRSIPWNILSKGMYSGYLTASGGDDLVSGGYLNLDGMAPIRIVVAPPESNQDLTQPWLPLFDKNGSHTQLREDPSLTGVEFTVKAYVTEGIDGDSGTLGVATVVEWRGSDGNVRRTAVRSTVYRIGCGDDATQPFLSACQPRFEASASTGDVTTALSATNVSEDESTVTASQPLTTPALGAEYTLGVRTAGVAAAVNSQQVSVVTGYLQYGGNQTDDADPKGYRVYDLRATDDVTSEWEANPTDETVTQASLAEGITTVFQSSSPAGFRARSDFGRKGILKASVTHSCMPGVPAGQPCVLASLLNNSNPDLGSGYIVMDFRTGGSESSESTSTRLSRRINDSLGETSGNWEEAWAVRFASASGNADTGCENISESGCVVAGATRKMAPLRIGDVFTSNVTPLSWTGDAPNGIVILEGRADCTYYTDSVRVERGPDQLGAPPVIDRCGQIRYWKDGAYVSVRIDKDTGDFLSSDEVTWTRNKYTVVASAQVRINPSFCTPDCTDVSPNMEASAGSISIVATYRVSWDDHSHLLISTTDIKSPSARALYLELDDA